MWLESKRVFLLLVLGVSLLYASLASGILYLQAQLQPELPQKPTLAVKISSPTAGQEVPVGELNITGISTDTPTTNCKVYVDWNDQKPFQNATATGLGGENDYSNWTFTYTKDYHLITNGTNNLTSKLSCVADESNVDTIANLTKSYSVNVIGVAMTTSTNNTAGVTSTSEEVQQQQQQEQESPTIDSNITTTKENNTAAAAEATPPELAPSVSTLSPVPLPPSIEEQEEEENTTIY